MSTPAAPPTDRKPITVRTLAAKHGRGEPITMLTAYDYPSARLADEAGIDVLLVGDSLAMVVLGHPDTLSVTMDEMLHHARAVRRGAEHALLVGDMPFMSYQVDAAEALRNAGRFVKEAGMHAVKLEGGRSVAAQVRAIAAAGIPVMGHVGLTPQSIHALGGWRVQGKTPEAAEALVADALALQEAGCFSIVLESVPDRLATWLTERLTIPTIGIGAGSGTSGQVLVYHDLLGLFERFTPKFVRRYAEHGAAAREAIAAYAADVASRAFPAAEHTYPISDDAWTAFLQRMGDASSSEAARSTPETAMANGQAQRDGR
jgi:3-methyl-2-oxobutanoate hydroxymethyltransferase